MTFFVNLKNKYLCIKKSVRRHICVLLVSLLIFGILSAVVSAMIKNSEVGQTENAAAYWGRDFALIRVNFAKNEGIAFEDIARFRYLLNSELAKEGIGTELESARLFADSYSGKTKSYASTTRNGSAEYNFYAVTPDYFYVHNAPLVCGSYLNDDTIMKDYVVLDVDAAWRLFGAIDVAGLTLSIGSTDYIVQGVVAGSNNVIPDEVKDQYAESASTSLGADSGIIYVHNSNADKIGLENVSCAEYIFPEPVAGFAEKLISKQLKSLGIGIEDYELVNATERFSYVNSIKRIGSWTNRGTDIKGIANEKWENAAIILENKIDFVNVFRTIALAFIVLEIVLILAYLFVKLDRFIKKLISSRRGALHEGNY